MLAATEDLSKIDKELLVAGYTRNNCMQHIPNVMTELIYDRYDETMYWHINKNQCNDFQVECGKRFTSPPIKYDYMGISFILSVYPNGSCKDDIGKFDYGFEIMHLPSNISSVTALLKISMIANDSKELTTLKLPAIFDYDDVIIGDGTVLKTSEMKQYDKITFIGHVEILDVIFNAKMVEFHLKDIMINQHIHYEWSINSEVLKDIQTVKDKNRLQSNTFGIGNNWCLRITPNDTINPKDGDVVIGLNILRLPNKIKNINVNYELELKTDKETIKFAENADMNYDDFSWVWFEDTYSTESFKLCSEVKISVTIDILKINNHNNQEIVTKHYNDQWIEYGIVID